MSVIATATDDKVSIVTREQGAKGLTGDAGANAIGFNEVRKRMLDAPLVRMFEKNNISAVIAGSLTATRSTTATYVDRYGVLKNAAINEMREEADGWLIEGASTNLFLQSQDFSTTWTQSLYNGGALDYWTMTTNTGDVTDPYGTNLAEKFVATATTQVAFARQTGMTLTAGQVYTFSCWIYVPTQAGVNSWRFGAVADSNARVNSSLKTTFDQWVRSEVTVDITTGTTAANIEINQAASTPTTGFTFYAFGAQCENLNFASSYIPTTTATVTRTADRLTLPTYYNSPVLSNGFSIAFDIKIIGLPPTISDYYYLFAIDNGNATDSYMPCMTLNGDALKSLQTGYFTEGLGGASAFSVGADAGDSLSLAYVFTGSGITLYDVNGEAYTYSVAATTNADLASIISLGGKAADSTQNAFIKISNFRIYDFALSSNEAQYLRDF